jgi:integrase
MGYPSVGLCALLCMELVQRPGDILNLRWGAYEKRNGTWYIRQTKRGAVVRVPETQRPRTALLSAKQVALQKSTGDINELLVCPTVTGKRWQRRNFTGTVRRIAKATGLPDDLQIRDLRRTGATKAASAGATSLELMAIGGWANQSSIRPYLVQTVEQAANAGEARFLSPGEADVAVRHRHPCCAVDQVPSRAGLSASEGKNLTCGQESCPSCFCSWVSASWLPFGVRA